jgi:Fic family protein
MKALGQILLNKRQALQLTVKDLSAITGIDTALISKYENGKRKPSEKHLLLLSEGLSLDYVNLRREFLANELAEMLRYEIKPLEILALAETRVEFLLSRNVSKELNIDADVQAFLAEITLLQNRWRAKKPLNKIQLAKIKEAFSVEYTFESNRIEGNTLTLQETHLVVNEGITIGGKSMREHLEAINHYEAVDYIINLAQNQEDLSERVLLELHYLVLKGIDKRNAGKYRKVGVRISGSTHLPPDAMQIEGLMKDFFIHYNSQKGSLHPVILAAEMHERLVSIHPFIDGNGRTSRLIMNLILLKNGYTIANLKGDFDSRMKYYKSLEAVQVNNEPNAFYRLVCQAVSDSLKNHLALV